MKHISQIVSYLTPSNLRDYYDSLFKLKLLTHYELYTKLSPYVVQIKDKNNRIIEKIETYIINKILITRDIDFDNHNEVLNKFDKLEGKPTDFRIIRSNVIIVINDDLSPVDITSKEIKYYTIIDRENLDTYTEFKSLYKLFLPSTLYCSMSISNLISILNDKNLKTKPTVSTLTTFIEKELEKGIEIDICFKNETKEQIGEYNYDHKYELEKFNVQSYKLNKNRVKNGFVMVPDLLHHEFDTQNILICFKNIFWSNILYLANINNLRFWPGKEKGMNFNACSLFTQVHNALITNSNYEKMKIMSKIIFHNETLKSCKEILDDSINTKIKKLLEYIDKDITTEKSLEQNLNQLFNIVQDRQIELEKDISKILIYGENIKQISYEILEKQKLALDDENIIKANLKWIHLNLERLEPQSLNILIKKIVSNYLINYRLNFLLILETILKSMYHSLTKIDIKNSYQIKNSSVIFVFINTLQLYLASSYIYNEFVKEQGDKYKQFLVNVPIEYLNNLKILNEIRKNRCYCSNEIKIGSPSSTIKFNLLFSRFEINLNLWDIFHNLDNKICTASMYNTCKSERADQKLNQNKTSNINNKTVSPDHINKIVRAARVGKLWKREFHTSTKINNKIIEMKESDFKSKEKSSEKKYSASMFNTLERIKELTGNGKKDYNPIEVQQSIENIWTDLTKDQYKESIHKQIEYLNPKIYDVFIFRNTVAIKRVFNTLYIFFNDIRLYVITYNIIATYFRRLSRTRICEKIADHILIHIYKNYLIPRLFTKAGTVKVTPKEFRDEFLLNKFKHKFKPQEFNELINYLDEKSLNLVSDQIDNIINSLSLRLYDDEDYLWENLDKIKYSDFIEEICYYSVNKKNKNLIKDKYDLVMEIKKFKIHFSERIVSSFEEMQVITSSWRDGAKDINILDLTEKEREELESDSLDLKVLEFNSKIVERNINKITNILPSNLPMISKPNKWSDKEYGGYFNNVIEEKSLITGIGVGNEHEVRNLDNLYKAINYTSSIRFSVNIDVLDFIINNNKILFKDYYSSEGTTIDDVNDHILRDSVTLKVAETYRNIPFYLNTYADWRGRIYTNSFYLTYQGSDLSLSLINFYEGEKITHLGEYYFKIYGANLYDENKISRASYSDRIKWVNDNEAKILSMDTDFLLKADSRFVFISFCFAYRRFKNNEIVYLPVSMDATASGLQLFSALTLDKELAKVVNLIPSEIDRVNDIYTEMLEPINNNIKNFVKNNPEYYKLGELNLSRKNIKAPIMCIGYAVTVKGMSLQLASSFEKIEVKDINKTIKTMNSILEAKNMKSIELSTEDAVDYEDDISLSLDSNELNSMWRVDSEKEVVNKKYLKYLYKAPSKDPNTPLYLTYKEVFKLAQLVYNSLFIKYPNLKNIFDYFNSISSVFNILDLPISWNPPSGLSITQKYLKNVKIKISISVGRGKQKTVVLSQNLNEMDTRAQTQALNPNTIHSLDSSLVILLLSKYHNKLHPFITIHDCYLSHSNKMFDVVNSVKNEFINIFENENIIEKFHNDLLTVLDNHNLKYKIEKNKIKILVKESLDCDLPVVKKYNLSKDEIKKQLTENKSLTRDQLVLSPYKKKKMKDLSFILPPKLGNLNIKDIKESSYLIT